eukprot:5323210-Pyramimonas_sp.AAC.1
MTTTAKETAVVHASTRSRPRWHRSSGAPSPPSTQPSATRPTAWQATCAGLSQQVEKRVAPLGT